MAFRVLVLGIGGVGGYIGGKLAEKYSGSKDVEINFIARGAHAEAIRQNGLTLITDEGTRIVHPHHVTELASERGAADVVLCCVKSYDLESSLEALRPCITSSTVLISLLNGVDGPERMHAVFPQAEVWQGCIYLVSRLMGPGVVKEMGNVGKIFFGEEHAPEKKLKHVESVLQAAGLNAQAPPDITGRVWEKFIFISSIATLTSALDRSIGEILANETCKNSLLQLLEEITAVARAKKISLRDDIISQTLQKLGTLPPETTSSMHRDFQKGKKTELESLTGYVTRLGKILNVPVPEFNRLYDELLKR